MKTIAVCALACALICSAAARAAEIDLATVINDPEGKAYQDCTKVGADGKCEASVDMTLGRMIVMAVNVAEPNAAPADVIKRGMIAERVVRGGKIDLAADDVSLIKAAIFKRGFTPFAAVRALALLDPASLKQ